jgi:hypothetical protein
VDDADFGLRVQKTGRTTEHTVGTLQSVSATVRVKYDIGLIATFYDQIVISQTPDEPGFSAGGDSGSLVYDMEKKCIGLLFAGSEGGENEPAYTIVSPIKYAFEQLDVELLRPGDHPSESNGRPARRKAKAKPRAREARGS